MKYIALTPQDEFKKRNANFKEILNFDTLPYPKEKRELYVVNLANSDEYTFVKTEFRNKLVSAILNKDKAS